MIFPQKSLDVFIVVFLLSIPASATEPAKANTGELIIECYRFIIPGTCSRDFIEGITERFVGRTVPLHSLWGFTADFTLGCSHWKLSPGVQIAPLEKFTVCFNLQLKDWGSSPWSAFVYRRPDVHYAELALGGKSGRFTVWLFGEQWTAQEFNVHYLQWYSLCLTWSNVTSRPALYVDGSPVGMFLVASAGVSPSTSPLRSHLAPNGSLTIGTPDFGVLGKISLFRMWEGERSTEEAKSLNCAEGDVVKWESDYWDTRTCAPIRDSNLRCEWSSFEVRLTFLIARHDGNNTELYKARDIAHQWLQAVLPKTFYLHRVSVFGVTRSGTDDLVKASIEKNGMQYSTPIINRFHGLVFLSVSPADDVATVQFTVYTSLSVVYKHPCGVDLLADDNSLRTTSVESFSATTDIPPTEMTPCPVPTSTKSPPSTTTTATTTTTAPTTSFTTSPSTSATTPANISDLYFQVKTNVSITGDYDPVPTISTWLNSSLPDDSMIVLDLELLEKVESHNTQPQDPTAEEDSESKVSRESCIFQVQVTNTLAGAQEMEEQIRKRLRTPYNNGAVSIETKEIEISRILMYTCSSENRQTRKGLFVWPETLGGRTATHKCPKNPSRLATRQCKLCLGTHWMAADLKDCTPVVETIPDLDHVKVTSDNAVDVLEMIEELLGNHSTLNYQELLTILSKLEDIVNLSAVTIGLSQMLINIISDILKSDCDLVPFTNTILAITEAVGDKMSGYEGSSTLVSPVVALSVVDVVPEEFRSLTFGVSSDRTGTNLEIYINKYPCNDTVAFVSLPSVLQYNFPQHNLNFQPPRVQFQFYGIPLLFQETNSNRRVLNTFVVSASVTNASFPIKDLSQEVQVTLHHLVPNTLQREVHCVYWNFDKNNGHGGWDDHGCRKHNSTVDYTTCLCDHLTHFGVLLDVSRTPVDPFHEQILTMITYLGCGVSSLFLGITVLTYTAFDKLRRDYPSQILINLSLALLGLNLVFLINSWISSWGLRGLCVAIASLLHYFLLASFTWMGLEAVNMYFALVKVFNVYVPSYILKFCALGWGLPLVICILVLIVNREAYGSHLNPDTRSTFATLDNSDNFCWLQDDVTFYVSVVAYAVLIFLFNIGVFIVVLIQIRHMRTNSPAGTRSGLMQDLKGVASLTLLLGLTWTAGFFTWGPLQLVLMYLFAILNTLQGLFIFFFHCLMRENVRKQWRIHLCFGRFRRDEYSEWSNSASVGVQAKPRPNPPRPSRPSVHSIKSSSTDSTSASSNSSQRDASCRRPNLGLFVNSLALPRAQRSPCAAEAPPSYRGVNPTPGWRNHLLDLQE